MLRPVRKTLDKSSDAGSINRRGGGGKMSPGRANPSRDVKNGTTSGDVHENKGQHDNLPDAKDDIFARLHAILHRNIRILWEPSALLPLFERWDTNPSLQDVETRRARPGAWVNGKASDPEPCKGDLTLARGSNFRQLDIFSKDFLLSTGTISDVLSIFLRY